MNVIKQTTWKFKNTVIVADHITDVDGTEMVAFHSKDRKYWLGQDQNGGTVVIMPDCPTDDEGNFIGYGILYMDTGHIDANASAFFISLRQARRSARKGEAA